MAVSGPAAKARTTLGKLALQEIFSLPTFSTHLASSNIRFRGKPALYKHYISCHFEKI